MAVMTVMVMLVIALVAVMMVIVVAISFACRSWYWSSGGHGDAVPLPWECFSEISY